VPTERAANLVQEFEREGDHAGLQHLCRSQISIFSNRSKLGLVQEYGDGTVREA
jgi:hypothetical protein